PGAFEPAVLYWFEFKPGPTPTWTPHQVDDDSGVGLHLVVDDMNKDKLPDIIVANKKGVHVFLQEKK
ncbi:MAG: VCBS repeat-containing protein, partial [Runella zeae]